ncbi:uncharacterized protein LOC108023919 [Drosophila biarmipes]|uniref:uncharacterized protein LOC108023919 n=1 Tax=Drosophila biarmipes TaxID=125945 RepID=UPI0007E7049C|nr:uncharacterized protein LOC108023919 [Drosophila biarmipes]
MNYQDMYGLHFESKNVGTGSNFEFRFADPESIPNAVRRHNALRGAELAQLKRQRETGRSHVPSMPRFCKVRRPGQDVTSMVTSRDLDVVTQLSLDAELICLEEGDDDGSGGKAAIPSYPASPRLCGGAESPRKTKRKSRQGRKKSTAGRLPRSRHVEAVHSGHTFERLEELHREVCAELQSLGGESCPPSPEATPRPPSPRRRSWAGRRRQGQQQQRKPPQEAEAGDSSLADVGQVSYEDYYKPQPMWADVMPSAMMSQAIKVNVCQAQNATPLSAYQFMEQHGSVEPEPLTPFFLEDSDLEHEYADRQGYLRYVEPRPAYEPTDSEDRDPARNNPDQPCFVELERRPHRISLLRSLSPMRYTSQRSEVEDQVVPQEAHKPLYSRRGTRQPVVVGGQKPSKFRRSNVVAKGSQKASNPRTRRPARVTGGGDEVAPSPLNPPNPPNPFKEAVAPANKRRKPKPLVVYSKSLEDLKYEKLGIYNKITLTQERIISALDKLQNSLLQLQVPHCSAQERQKRQRNAFEFCVRFSRNFLYPLKGMIDDVRFTSVASFNSATSNEACQRVVCVYGLMQQSIQAYQRQLRYFLLEKVPQKLSALIEMIYTMTNCCLDKGMLDRHDPVVECLQERCTRFLSFIEDMQEERFKLAREALRRLHKHQGGHHHQGHQVTSSTTKKRKKLANPPRAPTQPRQEKLRCHERYDLKMCLNDLKLYEPRLVPKERQQAEKRHRVRRPRNSPNVTTAATGAATTGAVELACDLEAQSLGGDDMQTQIQMAGDGITTTSSLSLLPIVGHGDGGQAMGDAATQQGIDEEQLHRALLDALHLVSRSQVQQVLDPLMRSLGVILGEKLAEGGGVHQGQ